MHGIFDHAVSFNADISGWSTGLVKDMSAAFHDAVSFDRSLDWNVAKVKTFSRMFRGAAQFKGKGLEHWDVSSAERADFMFEGAVEMSVDISDWGESVATRFVGFACMLFCLTLANRNLQMFRQ